MNAPQQITSLWTDMLPIFAMGMACYHLGHALARDRELRRFGDVLLWSLLAMNHLGPTASFGNGIGHPTGFTGQDLSPLIAAWLPWYFYFRFHLKFPMTNLPIAVLLASGMLSPLILSRFPGLPNYWKTMANSYTHAYLLAAWMAIALSIWQRSKKRSTLLVSDTVELGAAIVLLLPWSIDLCLESLRPTWLWSKLVSQLSMLISAMGIIALHLRSQLLKIRLARHHQAEDQLDFYHHCSLYGLSKREIEVAELLCAGLTYREVGEQLYISQHTVDNHVQRIFTKTGVKRRIELFQKLRPNRY